jgi:hypothetical protein
MIPLKADPKRYRPTPVECDLIVVTRDATAPTLWRVSHEFTHPSDPETTWMFEPLYPAVSLLASLADSGDHGLRSAPRVVLKGTTLTEIKKAAGALGEAWAALELPPNIVEEQV